jgi:hypothetical protein
MRTNRHWRRELRSETAGVLGSLGGDSPEVAEHLRSAGVQGTPGDPRDCAIAVFLSAVVTADPAVRTIKVTTDSVVVSPTRRWQLPVVVGLSEALRTFVAGFDRRAYPELIRPRGDEADRPERAAPQGSA